MSVLVEKETYALSKNLRCPVCEGQTVADSDAPLAQDIRAFIAKSLEKGHPKEKIISSLSTAYGNKILVTTPVDGTFSLLWLCPFVLIGLFVWWMKRKG